MSISVVQIKEEVYEIIKYDDSDNVLVKIRISENELTDIVEQGDEIIQYT